MKQDHPYEKIEECYKYLSTNNKSIDLQQKTINEKEFIMLLFQFYDRDINVVKTLELKEMQVIRPWNLSVKNYINLCQQL